MRITKHSACIVNRFTFISTHLNVLGQANCGRLYIHVIRILAFLPIYTMITKLDVTKRQERQITKITLQYHLIRTRESCDITIIE